MGSSSSRFWSCTGEEMQSYLPDHRAFGSTGSNELAGLCIKSVCFLSSAGGPSGGGSEIWAYSLPFFSYTQKSGIFWAKIPQNRKIWVPDAKKIPSAQKQEKFWVLEKKVLDPAQTGRPRMEFQCWQTRAKHWKRPHSGGRRWNRWQAPALETPIPHGFCGPDPGSGSPEQILEAAGRNGFRFTDRWSASSYQTDRTPGLRSYR